MAADTLSLTLSIPPLTGQGTSFYSLPGNEMIMIRSPDNAKIKQKMIYAASKDGLRKKLDGVYTEIQCTDLSEVSHETVLDKVEIVIFIVGYAYDFLEDPQDGI